MSEVAAESLLESAEKLASDEILTFKEKIRVLADQINAKKKLPVPSGYHILVALPESDEKTEGGIILTEETRRNEEVASVYGLVIAMGPDCYGDKTRFPTGPWCKVGDFVIMRAYTGARLRVLGKEFRIINDDSVDAVVNDPRGVKRV